MKLGRLALVAYDALDTRSGGYLYDRMLVDTLRARGVQVDFLPQRDRRLGLRPAENLAPRLAMRILSGGYDAVLEDELNYPSLVLLNRALRMTGAAPPLISIVHNLTSSVPGVLPRLLRPVEASFLRSVDGVVCNSRDTYDEVCRTVGKAMSGVVLWPGRDHASWQVTAEEIEARYRAPAPLRVLFLANVTRHKGLHRLLDALRHCAETDWQLDVAGRLDVEPRYVAAMREQIRSSPFAKRVRLLGPVVGERLGSLLAATHIMALPSAREGFGIAYLDALGAGVPVIASSKGGARELVDESCGFLVDPDDCRALVETLTICARDRERLAALGVGARQRHLAHPTWGETADRLVDWLEGYATTLRKTSSR